MKKVFTTILLLTATIYAKSQSQELFKAIVFDQVESTEKPGYGSKQDPILTGAFINFTDRTGMIKLKNSWRWPSGEKINFDTRFSTASADGKGIVDCYTLVNPTTKDTIKLFVDPYKTSKVYYTPKGLTRLSISDFEKELLPVVKAIEELEESKDAVMLRDQATLALDYTQSTIGTGFLVDEIQLDGLFKDKQVDQGLRSFLLRTYIFNRLYAYAKNIPDGKTYAFNKIKLNFEEFTVAHPEVKTGNVKEFLKM